MPTRSCAVHVTIFSTGGKFRPVSNFTKLYTLTLAAHSYVLLAIVDTNGRVTKTGEAHAGTRLEQGCTSPQTQR